jgi:MFS family permease
MAIVLFLPLFQRTPGLGPGKYGIAMSLMTGGMFAGMLLTSFVKIPPKVRFTVFVLSALVSMTAWAVFPLLNSFLVMLALLFIAGVFNAIINVFFSSTVQQTVPQEMRGKVLSLMGALLQGLTPLAMAAGGIIAEFFPIKYIITTCFTLCVLLLIPFAPVKSFRKFIEFDPEKEKLENII